MACLPTYKGIRYNSVEEMLSSTQLGIQLTELYKEYNSLPNEGPGGFAEYIVDVPLPNITTRVKEDKSYEDKEVNYTDVKSGIKELFDSNPELANAVYEAAGIGKFRVTLGKELDPEHKFGSQGEPIVRKFEVLDENKKIIGTVTLDIAKKGAITAHPKLTTIGKGYGQELYQIISLTFSAPVIEWGPHNISKSPEAKKLWSSLEKKGLAKAKYQWDDDIYLRGIDLLQQKQQALQQYSAYIDSIFPDSKIKDIVYHDTSHSKAIKNYKEYLQGKYDKKIDYINKETFGDPNYIEVFFKDGTSEILDEKESFNFIPFETFDKNLIGNIDGSISGKGFYFYTNPKERYDRSRFFTLNTLINIKNTANKSDLNLKDLFKEPNKSTDLLKKQGYDSVIGKLSTIGTEYIVFEPEQIHILGSKQDIEGFKEFVQNKQSITPRKGISELFAENPQFASIGTQEQYERYLSTIFPDSKVKDIVYHGTNRKFDKFDLSFNSAWEYNEVSAIFFSNKKEVASNYIIQNSKLLKDKIIVSALLNIKDSITDEHEQAEHKKNTKFKANLERAKKEGKDSYIAKNINDGGLGDVYAVFEPEQIHILGSKQDIEGFKKFVGSENIQYKKDTSTGIEIVEPKKSLALGQGSTTELDLAIQSYMLDNPNATVEEITEHLAIKGLINLDCSGGGITKAKDGLTNSVSGTGWNIVKDFKGKPKHSQGGYDITIKDDGFYMGDVKAENGLLIINN